MLGLLPLQIIEIGLAILAVVFVYATRNYLADAGWFVRYNWKFFALLCIIVIASYAVLTYKPPPLPPVFYHATPVVYS